MFGATHSSSDRCRYQSTPSAGLFRIRKEFGQTQVGAAWEHQMDGGRLTTSAGIAIDRQDKWRRGFDNFTVPTTALTELGVKGRLRRDERNTASTLSPYAQVEWDSETWPATAGLRRSRTRMTSTDDYVTLGNSDDSTSSEYSGTMPVLGLRYRLTDAV